MNGTFLYGVLAADFVTAVKTMPSACGSDGKAIASVSDLDVRTSGGLRLRRFWAGRLRPMGTSFDPALAAGFVPGGTCLPLPVRTFRFYLDSIQT